MDDLLIQLVRIKETIVDTYYHNHDAAIIAFGLLMLLLVLGFTLHKGKKVPGEEPKMKKQTREEYRLSIRELKQLERNLVADEVESFLLKLFTDGKITEERYRYWHLRFGTQLGLKDLLPVKMTPIQIKQAVKARLAKKDLIYRPVPFPKPGKKESILDKILAPHFTDVTNTR